MSKNALILSGGSVKGCFQAGAIQYVIESGFYPDIIYGTSVGSLNGAFLTNAAGQRIKDTGNNKLTPAQWNSMAQELIDFWKNRITKPDDVAIKRKGVAVIWDIIWNKFEGLSDTTPINDKIHEIISTIQMASPTLEYRAVTVEFISSKIIYSKPSDKDFISNLKGSFAIPIAMPPSTIGVEKGRKVLFDGGVRAVAPFGEAINEDAVNIIGILCQSDELDQDTSFNEKNLMSLTNRIQDIVINQNVKNDKKFAEIITKIKSEAINKGYDLDSLKNYDLISSVIIQPQSELKINIEDFNSVDIANGIKNGYDTAKKIMTSNPSPWIP